MPGHINVAFFVSRDRSAAIEIGGPRDQVTLGLEAGRGGGRGPAVKGPRVEHRRAAGRGLRKSTPRAVPGDMNPTPLAQRHLAAPDGAHRNRTAKLAVDPDRRGETLLPR